MISFETHFDRATLDRGKTYQRAGHVVSVSPDKDGGLEARVHNGKGTTYRQSIQIKPATARKPDGEVLGLCSCPMAFNCKHVAAALLDYQAQAALLQTFDKGEKETFGARGQKAAARASNC